MKQTNYARKIKRWLIIFIQCMCVLPLFSQGVEEKYTFNIVEYNSENVGAGELTNVVLRDSRGVMWVGTQSGLHLFDGRTFTTFDEDYGLPFNQVMELNEDSEGWFWIFRSCRGKDPDYCYKTLAFFHHTTYEVKTIEERFGEKLPFALKDIEDIISNPAQEKVVVMTTNQTFTWTPKEQWKSMPTGEDGKSHRIFAILEDGRMGGYRQGGNERYAYLLMPNNEEKRLMTFSQGYFFRPYLLLNNTVVLLKDGNPSEGKAYQLNEKGKINPFFYRKPTSMKSHFWMRGFLYDKSSSS